MVTMEQVLKLFWNSERPIRSVLSNLGKAWVAFVCYKALTYYRYVSKYKSLFPGPSITAIGMMPPKEMDDRGGFKLDFFKWAHKEYGPIFGFFMGFEYYISIDRPEALQQVHKKGDERPDGTFKVVNYLFKENVLFQHGEWQRILRRSYQNIIDHPEVRQKLQTTAFEALEKEIAEWPGSEVNVHQKFHTMIYDVMGMVLFGQAWSDSDVGKRIKKAHLHCVENVMKFAFNPMARGPEKDEYDRNRQAFWDEISGLLAKRRAELKGGAQINTQNVVDMLLTAKRKDLQPDFYKDDPKPEELLYDNATAVATMAVFLNGSFDTTLNSTCWTLYWFAKNPEVQKKFQQALDKSGLSLKKGCPTPDKDKLDEVTYLDAVIREGMRKMPAAPINMRINFDQDYVIDNLDKALWHGKDKVTIPAGATVICPYECSMMKEDVFGADCPAFNPDRFMGDDEKATKCKQMWTPFGGHKRMCVGQNFAKQEIRLFLAILLSRFTFKLKNPDQEVGAKYEAGINVIDVTENGKSTGTQPTFIVEKR